MPYPEVELAAARDFFLSPANFDETDLTVFYPAVIDSPVANMSRQTVLHYHSSWNPSACHPTQITLPIPGWLAHFHLCLPSLVPASGPPKNLVVDEYIQLRSLNVERPLRKVFHGVVLAAAAWPMTLLL